MIVEFERARHTTNTPNSGTHIEIVHGIRRRESHMRFVLCLSRARVCARTMRTGAVLVRVSERERERRRGLALMNQTKHSSHFGVEFRLNICFHFVALAAHAGFACAHNSLATESTSNEYKKYRARETATGQLSIAQSKTLAAADALTHNALNRKPIMAKLAHSCARIVWLTSLSLLSLVRPFSGVELLFSARD